MGCKVEGCEKKVVGNGYCIRHDAQMRVHGKIFGNPFRTIRDPNEITVNGNTATMKLYNRHGFEIAETVFDVEDIHLVEGRKWHLNTQGYVAHDEYNPRCKIFFAREIMRCDNSNLHTDHIDGDPLNNRKTNLRICTSKENSRNKHKSYIGKSKYKGVSLTGGVKNPYAANIRVDYKKVYIGVFNKEVDAAIAYNEAALKHHGEFAHLNEV